MKLFYYPKSKGHTSDDTDNLIKESAKSIGLPSCAVKRTHFGKPYLENCDIYVGVTHSDSLVVIGLSYENFGIDCEEKTRKIRNAERLAKKYFSQKEYEFFMSQSDHKDDRFLEIWVKKEAYIKYKGESVVNMKKYDIFALDGTFEKIENKDHIIYIYKGCEV